MSKHEKFYFKKADGKKTSLNISIYLFWHYGFVMGIRNRPNDNADNLLTAKSDPKPRIEIRKLIYKNINDILDKYKGDDIDPVCFLDSDVLECMLFDKIEKRLRVLVGHNSNDFKLEMEQDGV